MIYEIFSSSVYSNIEEEDINDKKRQSGGNLTAKKGEKKGDNFYSRL
jgi:hypothetical protein